MTLPPTFGQMLAAQARLQPNRIGARDLEREMSFRLWDERARRLANALLGLGLSKGDRVGVLSQQGKLQPVLTEAEWRALQSICDVPEAGEAKNIRDWSGAIAK